MLSAFYNYFIVILFLLFVVKQINLKYFHLNNNQFIITLSYHLFLTGFFLFLLRDQPADYRHYLELKHIKPFALKHSFATTELIYNFIKILKNVFFLNKFNIVFIFSLISYFGILIFVKNLIKIGVEKKIALLLFFIPGFHLWTSLPGKDCFILFLLSCFFYFYINKINYLSFVFLFIVLLIRPQIGTIFFLSVMLTEFLIVEGRKKLIILLISVLGFYFIISSGISGTYLIDKHAITDNIILKMIAKISDVSSRFSLSGTSYESSNILFNIFNYLIFPTEFIFKSNSFFVNLSIMVELFTLLFVVILIKKNKKNIKLDKKLMYFLLACALIYLLILPQALFNFGVNIRQKWMIVPFLIYLSFFLKNLFVKLNKI